MKREVFIFVTALLLGATCAWAGAVYRFAKITNYSATDLAPQFSMEVNEAGGGQIEFLFRNTGPLPSSITDIEFYNSSQLGASELANGDGVLFERRPDSLETPWSNEMGLARLQLASFEAMPSPDDVVVNGVNPGEQVGIRFALSQGRTFTDMLASLAAGADRGGLWIGLNAHSLLDGQVDSFESVALGRTSVVPLPLGAWMGIALLATIAGAGYFSKRHNAAF